MKTINGRSVSWLGFAVVLLTLAVAACDKKSPVEPTPPPAPPTPDPTYSLSGTVTDGLAPVAGASVRIIGGNSVNFGKTATTNASGVYTIAGVAAERIIVEAAANLFEASNKSPTVTGNTTLDFELSRSAFTVSGTVTDTTSGGVLPGVEVRITGGSSPNFGKATVTDAAGRYTIPNVAAERIVMEASATGYQVSAASPTVTANSTVDFRLNRLGPSTGVITFRIDHESCGTTPSSPIVDVFIDDNNVGTIYNVTTPGSAVSRTVSTGPHTVAASGGRGASYPLTNVNVIGMLTIPLVCTE